MRLARFGLAATTAVLLVGAAAATVAARRTVERTDTTSTIHVDITPLDAPPAAAALRMDTVVGSDAERRLGIEGALPGAGSPAISFLGTPEVSTLRVDSDMAEALLVESFTGIDGAVHVLRAEVHASAPVETWTSGPFAASVDGAMAAFRTCASRAVPATAIVTLDGVTVGATGSSTIADIVVRDCSTVALYR